MTDEEFSATKLPNVGFDGDGAGGDGGVEGDTSPVVIMGVDGSWEDVAGKGGWIGVE